MLPSSVPDLTAQTDANKEMQLTDNEKIKKRQCRIQNIENFEETVHDTSTLSVLPHSLSVSDSKTQSGIDNNIQSLNKLIINDNYKNITQSTIQNIEIHSKTNTDTYDAPILSLSSSVPDSTTETDLIDDIVQGCNSIEIEHDTFESSMLPSRISDLTTQLDADFELASEYIAEQKDYCPPQDIETFGGIVHNTSNYSTFNYQDNASSNIYSEQISENVAHNIYSNTDANTLNNQYQLITINETNQAITTPAPVMITSNISISDSSKAPLNHEVASMKQFVPNKTQTVMELHSCKQVTEKDLMSTSTPNISHNTSGKEHAKMDSDPHPVGKFKLPCLHSGCGKSFTRKSSLKRHARIHTEERPFNCKYCDKRFKDKGYLNRHILIHTGKKPFNCEYCEKSFNDESNLRAHIRIHTGNKPFNCEYCNKSFCLNRNLKTHILTHTGEKLYTCTACSMKFARQDSLQNHKRRRHKILSM